MLVNHILETFKCSLITIWFYDGVLPSTALEFMKMVNQRQLRIKSFYCHIKSESSELIPRILDECSEVTDSILVSAAVPDDFMYTPSRPFKAKAIDVRFRTNWLKLDSCMSCRNASVELGENSNRTTEIYNSFFTKWMDSDAQLQSLMLSSIEKHEYQMIMNALSNQGTKRAINEYWFEIKRKDESEFFIFTFNRYIRIYTKQAYLENLGVDEENALTRNVATNLQVQEPR
uniref:FBA_2 domain-containing protein n=1 Tax=Caenorhabditis tropicalis TaxID=1561998 RepID=A0A1I7UTI8_9PELO